MRVNVSLLVSLLLLVCVTGASADSVAPPWELTDLEGQTRRIEDWRGQWILLKFGTTQCPNCAVELEEMAKLESELDSLGVEVLDIYLAQRRHAIKKYWKKKDFAYRPTILYEWSGGRASQLARDYGFSVIPHLVLVDPEGNVAWKGGFTPGAELMDLLESHVRPETAAGG